MIRTILAIIAAAVAMFSLAGLYTGVLARSFIEANVDKALMRSPPNLFLVFFGYLVLAVLMAVIYQRYVRLNGSPAWNGLRFGMATAVCWLMPYSLVLFGVYNFPYIVLPLDFVWALIEQGVGGLIIGFIYGKSHADA
jgi:uncharacterized membrane protein YidH (DUF202 family)